MLRLRRSPALSVSSFTSSSATPLCYSPVQSLSRVRLFVTPWITAGQASLSITNSEFTQTHVHWVGDAIQPTHPLLFPSSAFNLSQWKVVAKLWKIPGFLASGGEEFNLGLDHSQLLCDKDLLKHKRDSESFWHRHQKGAERAPPC